MAFVLNGILNSRKSIWNQWLAAMAILAGIAVESRAETALLNKSDLSGSAFVNGALFRQDIPSTATGTGTFHPFLAIGGDADERGYNHDLSHPVLFEDVSKTENIQLGMMPIMSIDHVQYLEFLLDAGEPSGGDKAVLHLTEFQVYLTSLADQTIADPGNGLLPLSLATLHYDLDGNEDNTIVLDGSLSAGNGKRDLGIYLPLSLFENANPELNLVVYARFAKAHGTFEEIGFDPSNSETYSSLTPPPVAFSAPLPVPSPSSLPIGLIGMSLLSTSRRRATRE